MPRIILAVLVLLTLALLVPTARADDYVLGEGGYYWKAGVAYTQSSYKEWWQESEPYSEAYSYYDSYGCYRTAYRTSYRYVWKWRWQTYYTPVKLNYDAPDVEAQLVKLAASRDAAVFRIAQQQAKSQSALALADKLGLAGNFNIPAYGAGIFPLTNYAGYGQSLQLSTAGVQGATVMGYSGTSYKSVTDAYGTTDLNALYLQSAQLTKGAQSLAGDANSGFQSLVSQAGANQGRVAESLAKAQAAAIAMRAAEPAPQTHTETTLKTFGTVPAISGRLQAAPVSGAAAWLALSGPGKCVKCHSGEKVSGGFDVTKYHPSTSTTEEKARVIAYITSADANKRCPPKSDPLPGSEVLQFLQTDAMPTAKE